MGAVVGALLGLKLDGDDSSDAEEHSFGFTRAEIEEMGASLPPGGSAGLLLIEHVWARGLEARGSRRGRPQPGRQLPDARDRGRDGTEAGGHLAGGPGDRVGRSVNERLAAPGRLLRRAVGSMFETAGTRDAAQVAYYLVMSLPAALLLLVWAFSTLLDDDSVREPIVDAIVDWLPISDDGDRAQIEALLDDVAAGAGSLGWISVVALLYSASGAIGGIRHAVNEAWQRPEERPWVPARARDAGVTLLAAPLVIVAFGLVLSGDLASSIGDRPWLAAVAQFAVTRFCRWRCSSRS